MRQPLEGLRVLELAEGIAGPYAGKLFADLGADVVKLEPPSGDRSRAAGPAGSPGGRSPAFLHLNTNKRSAVADVHTATGRELALSLAATSDIVIESMSNAEVAATGLGYDALAARRSGLVVVSVTPFGRTGPYADWKGEEIVTYAHAGVMTSTGLASREPLKMGADIGQYHLGNIAALAALGATTVAARSGRSIHVDAAGCDAQFGSVDRRLTYFLYQVFTGCDAPRSAGAVVSVFPSGVFPTADGYVMITTAPRWVDRMLSILNDEALAARFAAGNPLLDPELPELVFATVLGWTIGRTSQEAMEEAQAVGWPVTALKTPTEVLDDPHLAERGFFVDVDLGAEGRVRQPGAPIRFHAGGWELRTPAPVLGAHQAEVEAEAAAAGASTTPAPAPPATEPRLPLEGVVVVEMTVAWAGPYATQLLADLGATVIRVDNPNLFPTNTRGVLARPTRELLPLLGALFGGYPDREPGERPWNRAGMYLGQARGKWCVTVDPRTPLGRQTLHRLIARADVLVENNGVELMDKLGLGWPAVSEINPRLIAMRLPSTGLDGPYRHFLGFGTNMEALFGLTSLRGYPDADPSESDSVFHMDAASGGAAAFAALAALRRREHTGVGELVEFAQTENMLNHIGELLVELSREGAAEPEWKLGNRHRWRAPQGAYRCVDAPAGAGRAGEVGAPTGLDRWVAISVGTDAEWAGLRAAMGDPAWATDERFATADGRRDHHDEIDAGITAWTGALTHQEAAARCQAHGVPAAPVQTEGEQRVDPHLRARNMIRPNEGPEIDTHEFGGHAFTWDGPPLVWGPLAAMGQQNEEVYRGLLGFTDAEWDALVAEGHISGIYLGPDGVPL